MVTVAIGPMCNFLDYLLTEMQYHIHNYVFNYVFRDTTGILTFLGFAMLFLQ